MAESVYLEALTVGRKDGQGSDCQVVWVVCILAQYESLPNLVCVKLGEIEARTFEIINSAPQALDRNGAGQSPSIIHQIVSD